MPHGRVAKTWGRIADETNCAVQLVHHVRKTNGAEISVEDGRGAVALLAAASSARVLNVMSEEEATKANVENRRLYFRVTDGKGNVSPPAERSDWHKMESVDLGKWPSGHGRRQHRRRHDLGMARRVRRHRGGRPSQVAESYRRRPVAGE